ncbi:hypothetical protein [Pseudonocardia acidicola]|uniref:Integral membrane protein n=1 Tax=Pseudonocardia acidicola TaxID=2724939 RepID=A0ABX1SEP1_9PSEU|nr:hypothetical protein [Pseudonocardia acidicola]NMH99277.1 hypothetical protein [Pseudonocardia acidicola]
MRTDPDRRRPSARGRLPRRRTDRWEDAIAWLLTSLALLTVLLAIVTGVSLRADGMDRVRAQAAERTAVSAVLLEDAKAVYGVDGGPAPVSLRVPARWVGPDGVEHTGRILVSGPRPAGAVVTAWLDRHGAVVSAPGTSADATIIGIAGGVGVLAGGWLLLSAAWAAARRWIENRNATAWAADWALVEPEWSGRR